MIDQADYRVAKRLAERHFYPFAENIYIDIFKAFSHFPLSLKKLGINGEGETITLMALSAQTCFETDKGDFESLFEDVLKRLKILIGDRHPQDITVDVLLGCVLYFYHPSEIRGRLSSFKADKYLTDKQQYEFELKKKTFHIHII